MKTIQTIMKKSSVGFLVLAFAFGSFGITPSPQVEAATTWDTTGSYVINMNYLGTDHSHDLSLTQDIADNLTGNGGTPTGANTYTWVITSGTVTGDTIDFLADYTATSDAVTPQTTLHVIGAIAEDGTISGTWSDNYAGGERAGTVSTVSGAATTDTEPDPTPETSTVTIQKYIDGAMATAVSADNADFQINATWVISGTPGSGVYTLSETSDPTPYQAMTSDLPNGSDYGTSEIMDTVVGVNCAAETPFALTGYTFGDTLAEAMAATPSLVAPSFTDIQTDKFVIVLNDDCATEDVGGEIGGEVGDGIGTLEVTSIEMTDSTATANNSFEDGWEYVFHITVPTDEPDVIMKFANWERTGGSETIPAGNNMRISSLQADNGGATVLITAANTFSSPALTMTTDLDPTMDGIQVEVTVEVKIPTSTVDGSYTTSYGVRSEQ